MSKNISFSNAYFANNKKPTNAGISINIFWWNFLVYKIHSIIIFKLFLATHPSGISSYYKSSLLSARFACINQSNFDLHIPPMEAFLFPGRPRPGKRIASIGRRFYIDLARYFIKLYIHPVDALLFPDI